MSLFLTDDVELRTGWKLAVYVMVWAAILVAMGAVLSEIMADDSAPGVVGLLVLNVLAFLPPSVGAFLFMLRFAETRRPAAFGVTLHSGWGRDIGTGGIVAAAMVAMFLLGSRMAGTWSVAATPRTADSGWLLPVTIVLLGLAAAGEELVYRGYPFQVLIGAVGPLPAILVMSVAFGLGHYGNPNVTWTGTLNISLAGALLAAAYLRTRSLWLPWGIHLGWNVGTGALLGLPVSGVRLSAVWQLRLDGPAWLTGGSFGPEGGVLATIVIIAAAVWIVTTGSIGLSPEVRAALPGGAQAGQTAVRKTPVG